MIAVRPALDGIERDRAKGISGRVPRLAALPVTPKGRERILHHVFGLSRIRGDPQRRADKLGPVLLHKGRKTRRITCRRITRHGSICASYKNDPAGGAIRLRNRETILAGAHATTHSPTLAASFPPNAGAGPSSIYFWSLIGQSEGAAEAIIAAFYGEVGWSVEVRWATTADDAPAAAEVVR